MHIQLWGIKDNFEYVLLNANCCGEFIREKFPISPTDSLRETTERAIEVATKTFMILAETEVSEKKERYGDSYFIN